MLAVWNKFSMSQKAVSVHYISLESLENFVTKGVPEYLISHVTVTFNEAEADPNAYQNVEFSSVYHP